MRILTATKSLVWVFYSKLTVIVKKSFWIADIIYFSFILENVLLLKNVAVTFSRIRRVLLSSVDHKGNSKSTQIKWLN